MAISQMKNLSNSAWARFVDIEALRLAQIYILLPSYQLDLASQICWLHFLDETLERFVFAQLYGIELR
jgi:hypothetical protein